MFKLFKRAVRAGTKAAKAQAEPTFWRRQLHDREREIHALMGALRGHPEVLANFDNLRGERWDQTEEDAEFVLTRAVPMLRGQAELLGVVPRTVIRDIETRVT